MVLDTVGDTGVVEPGISARMQLNGRYYGPDM